MPELPEEMYCSEQICIPPTFPYLLRQYAKAAIRTQPSDLLRWSATYFRCLALNIPPPVKPRLEYPIPRDHYGLTPGWLKALLCQLPGTETINFKILWDRWIGACLKHQTLIEILCLAGFDDPNAIPFLRFIAICVAHLTDNLTQTMIIVCETLTEEPEGGSAMITLETFVDLYRFLAAIDASHPQTLKNLYFTDDLLGLCPESEEKIAKEVVEEAPSEFQEESVEIEEATEEAPEAPPSLIDLEVVVSCPDLQADDFEPGDLEKYDQVVDDDSKSRDTILGENIMRTEQYQTEGSKKADEDINLITENPISEVISDTSVSNSGNKNETEQLDSSVLPGVEETKEDEDETELQSDLEKLKAAQEEEEETAPSVDEDIEIFKKVLYAEQAPISADLGQYADIPSDISLRKEEEIAAQKETTPEEEQASHEVYEEVHVEAIPGIGGIVPETLVEAVVNYMKEMAAGQHGMVMPRNVRHYRCPPLEPVAQ